MRLVLPAVACLAGSMAQAAVLKATLMMPQDDTRLERSRVERACLGHAGGPATDALKVALEEGRFELDAAGSSVALATAEAGTLEAARTAALNAEKAGAAVSLADLQAVWTLAVADTVKVPVLNLGAAADSLREQDCRARRFHLLPSERMRADVLAQALVSRRWTKPLLLTGFSAADRQRAAASQASIKRYGLQMVGSKAYKLSAGPRERELANPLLLTAGARCDAVWVIDSDGELARSLPYRTVLPRPLVGDTGLVALAWHAQFERFGAPKVSRRFARATQRPMTAHDGSAWIGGELLVALATALPQGPNAARAQALPKTTVDGSKGTTLGLRPWHGQLRQPLMLNDGQGAILQAPVDGVRHPSNVLDTLGADAPEKACKTAR